MKELPNLFWAARLPGFVRVALVVGMGVSAALGVRSWLDAHEEQIRLKATLDAQSQVIESAQERERHRADELKAALAQIAELKRSVTTPQQIVRDLPQYLPLPQPIQIAPPTPGERSEPTSDPGNPRDAPNPGSGGDRYRNQQGTGASPQNGMAQMPVTDLKPLFDFVQDCRACKVQLEAAQAHLADEKAKAAALVKERDAAVKAARGGGFWSRVRHGAKWFLLGVGAGAVAVAASR